MKAKSDVYYRNTLCNAIDHEKLTETRQADVCVVGGGLAGMTAALTLSRFGKKVVVLEAEKVGWGASGRNGGAVSAGYSTGYDNIKSKVGREDAIELHRMSEEGVAEVRNNITDLDIRSAVLTEGRIQASRVESDATYARVQRMNELFDSRFDYLKKDDIRSKLVTDRYFDGIYDPKAFHIHPLNYLTGIAAEVVRLGGAIYEHSGALRIADEGGRKTVDTEYGRVEAEQLLVCCGGYTDGLVPRLRRSYIPISTFVMATRQQPELIAQAIKTRFAVGDDRRSSDYYRLVDGGKRLLWGGMITTKLSKPADMSSMLKKRILNVYPQLAAIEVETSWSGRMAYARHLMPQIGRLREGVWYCTGFGGHGINTSTIGGKIISEAILGESDRYKLFSEFGLKWNGSGLGRVAVQTVYWKYRISDWLREKK